MGTAITLGICSLMGSASADVFNPFFPPPTTLPDTWGVNSTNGEGTSGSFAAASVMGAKGYSNYLQPSNWESVITTACTSQTAAHPTSGQVGVSQWPSACNPQGMVLALNSGLPFPAAHWVTSIYQGALPGSPDPNKTAALNAVVASLQTFHSPAVIPMYGQADHWVAITQVVATNTAGVWNIAGVKYYDGGPVGGAADSGFNSYAGAGIHSWSGTVFAGGYYSVITAINPGCDPCTSDPYYSKWVLLFEPPVGENHPPVSAAFKKAPGISPVMNETLAQAYVWRALTAASIDTDPQIWNPIVNGVAGAAFRVNAVFPSGSPWNYYLVPILSKTDANTAIAFVQLGADDGSFEGVHVLPAPTQFAPATMMNAKQLARSVLTQGERLTGGALTWDPRSNLQIGQSPTSPYYEFGVSSASNPTTTVGVVRVRFNDGMVVRSL
jgi:hypothetical protein